MSQAKEEIRIDYWRIVHAIQQHSYDTGRSVSDILEELERDTKE